MCSTWSNAFEASKNTAFTDEPWVTKYEAVCFDKNVHWSVLWPALKPNWLSVVPRKGEMLDKMKCSSSFWHHCGYCNWSVIWSVRHIPILVFAYGNYCCVFGYIPVNNAYVKQFTEKKTQRFICIQQVLCRNTIRPWRFVQGQLLKKCCQGDKRTHGHFKTQIVLLAVYAVFHRLCWPIARVFRV